MFFGFVSDISPILECSPEMTLVSLSNNNMFFPLFLFISEFEFMTTVMNASCKLSRKLLQRLIFFISLSEYIYEIIPIPFWSTDIVVNDAMFLKRCLVHSQAIISNENFVSSCQLSGWNLKEDYLPSGWICLVNLLEHLISFFHLLHCGLDIQRVFEIQVLFDRVGMWCF